jgi:hypothetical protein
MIVVAVFLIQRLLLPMPSSNEKKIFIGITVAGTVLFELLLIASAFIPSGANKLISQGIVSIETNINKISPNYTNEVLDVEKAKSLISDVKQIRYYMDENQEVNFVVKLIGLGAYIGFAEDFCDHIESNFVEFQKEKIPFTLHNIFDFIQKKSQNPILRTTKIIETVIILVAAVFYLILLVAYFINKKGLLTPQNKCVTFGEEEKL